MKLLKIASFLGLGLILASPCCAFSGGQSSLVNRHDKTCLAPPKISHGKNTFAFLNSRAAVPQAQVMSLRAETENGSESEASGSISKRTIVEGALWVGLLGVAALVSPGRGDEAASAADLSMVMELFANPYAPNFNPIFFIIFNYLGVFPLVYSALLLPGAKNQKLPAAPFLALSVALGYFAVGPYLSTREYRPAAKNEGGWGLAVLESKVTAVLAAAFIVYNIVIALGIGLLGEGAVPGFLDLTGRSQLAFVSSLDCTVLSLCVVDPLVEDMRRRGWYAGPEDLPKALGFALPLVGPALYLLLRPALPTAPAGAGAEGASED